MKPTIGRIVIVRNLFGVASKDEPALITRVHFDVDPAAGMPASVSVSVLADGEQAVICKSSLQMFDTRADADTYLRDMVGHYPCVCHWPDREPSVRAVSMPLAA